MQPDMATHEKVFCALCALLRPFLPAISAAQPLTKCQSFQNLQTTIYAVCKDRRMLAADHKTTKIACECCNTPRDFRRGARFCNKHGSPARGFCCQTPKRSAKLS